MVNNKQHTIVWHVDDVKSSHIDSKVNDEFLKWLQMKYGSDNIGKVKATRGKVHDYLAMKLDYSETGILKVDMTDYVKSMIQEFPEELTGKVKSPWNTNLFHVDPKSKLLDETRSKVFHTFVMKGMFLAKRGRQDIMTGIAYLSTKVTNSSENDWWKLKRLMLYLKNTANEVCRLEAGDTQTIQWYVDAAFAVHKDFRSHTGAVMSLGKGMISSVSIKQKVNTRSSTEAELVAIDDVVSKIIWTKRFIENQGFQVETNIVYQDNQSTMKLEENGKESSGKRTRHFNVKYFYVTDLIKKNELKIVYCPSDIMIADYMTKPLVGSKFTTFKKAIMNTEVQQECVVPDKLDDKNLNPKKVKFKNESDKKESRNSKRNYHSFVTT